MENINLEELDNESLIELMSILEGMDEALDEAQKEAESNE